MSESARDKPWLKNAAWRRRRGIVYRPLRVRGSLVFLAGLFFVGPFLVLGLVALFTADLPAEGALVILLMLAGMAALVGGLGYVWWRHRRHGTSVCRLVTLPCFIDGPFAADVDCALPPDPAPVVLRLKNFVWEGRSMKEVWRTEEALEIAVSSARTIVPVRLNVPRDPAQLGGALWILEIEKKCAGVDFHDAFIVPVFDRPAG